MRSRSDLTCTSRVPALLITVAGHAVLCACLLAAPLAVSPRGGVPSVVTVSVLPDAPHKDVFAPPAVRLAAAKPVQTQAPVIPLAPLLSVQSARGAGGGITLPEKKSRPGKAEVSYPARVSMALAAVKRYPLSERMARHQGTVWLLLHIAADGHLLSVTLQHSSGVQALDRAALRMAEAAAPYPPVPDGMGMQISVPVTFSLNA